MSTDPRPFDREKIETAVRMILEGIGEDPDREGLRETPARVARMYEEICRGIGVDARDLIKVFTEERYDELVLVKDIPLYSLCEHHLLPFIGTAHVGYIPEDNRVTGLSKIPRIVDTLARKPQVQERLTVEIADVLMESLRPQGVIVVIEAEHLCLSMRGVQKPGTRMRTSVVRGIFRRRHASRDEALRLMGY
jgi:GTP cyclohydrolase I